MTKRVGLGLTNLETRLSLQTTLEQVEFVENAGKITRILYTIAKQLAQLVIECINFAKKKAQQEEQIIRGYSQPPQWSFSFNIKDDFIQKIEHPSQKPLEKGRFSF
ncbi:hypothetical protein FGO68_gene15276 [Halteria grandinella]|uniref:Uncharacterized protein n=1 Tax=Halteria grandinella TaxID=5974 RepID=A0A8J8SZE6_HALGN|nr:hypothetical protein FGO68_gene15276 [Halteria grandinella]